MGNLFGFCGATLKSANNMAKSVAAVVFVLLAFFQCQTMRAFARTSVSPDSIIVFQLKRTEPAFELHRITLNDCRAPRCKLIKGTIGTLTIQYTSPIDIPKLNVVIYGYIAGLPVPWAVPGGSDACPRITPKLPGTCVQAGVKQTFSLSLPISSSYPSMNVGIEIQLKDGDGNKKVSFRIPATLMSS